MRAATIPVHQRATFLSKALEAVTHETQRTGMTTKSRVDERLHTQVVGHGSVCLDDALEILP